MTYQPRSRARGPTVAGIRPHAAGQVVFAHCKIADTQELRQIHRASRMACPKIALTMLILGSIMVLGTDARAQADAPGPARLAQAPTQPAPPATPPSPPAASQPAAQTSPQTPDPVGSVATLQGTASVTRNNATSALRSATRSTRTMCCRLTSTARLASPSTTRPRSRSNRTHGLRWTSSSISRAAPTTPPCSTCCAAPRPSSPPRSPIPAI